MQENVIDDYWIIVFFNYIKNLELDLKLWYIGYMDFGLNNGNDFG